MLTRKKIILGICGSIAAYKAAELVRLLVKAGADVKVLMTNDATQFITPLTLSTLSKHPVINALVDEQSWNSHVELGLWADAYVIAPISANTIAKLANGFCDNILTATYLSARCDVFLAPAMDLDMWQHPATKRNVETLINDGAKMIDVESGELASGLVGPGRMAEPQNIVKKLESFFNEQQNASKKKLSGVNALVSAGPTHERIDPVRYITNDSSGKMGIAIAEALAEQGAHVELVLGPVHQVVSNSNIVVTNVETAAQMHDELMKRFAKSDIAIMAAAVADYSPLEPSDVKLKKKTKDLTLQLKPTIDILAAMGEKKKSSQLLVGFALETNDERENAVQKLQKKNLDFVVLNSLRDAGAGFGGDTNKITIFDSHAQAYELPLLSKKQCAEKIVERVAAALPLATRV